MRQIRLGSAAVVVLVLACVCLTALAAAWPATNSIDTNAVQAEMDAAIHQVEKIVNQPVPAYRQAPGMRVAEYHPGWFHPGAITPDFNHVDVRTTQETPYAQNQYVTSDLNPGIVFPGNQLEFNSMTKYFYTNRNLPKKKLTEAEMLEINRLYRIIGQYRHEIKLAQGPPSVVADDTTETNGAAEQESPAPAARKRLLNPYIGGGAILVLLLLVIISRKGR